MTDRTTATTLVVAALLLAAGAVVGVGATGSAGTPATATDAPAVAAQDTTTAQENATDEQENATDEQETTTQAGETNETTAQTNETTAQADGTAAGDGTNLTASNVTIERLVLRNVTVTDARFGELTVLNATGGENASNETYSDVALDRVEATGETTDLTLTNVTVRNESLADALLNETGRLEIQTRLIMDLAVLQDRTVNGLAVEQATVSSEVAENVSVSTAGGDQQADDGDAATEQNQPALSAGTAEVEGVDLTNLSVAGASVGATAETTATETATDGETAAEGTTTETTAVEVDGTPTTEATTTAATGNETTTTETTKAEARSGATDEGTTTTTANGTDES